MSVAAALKASDPAIFNKIKNGQCGAILWGATFLPHYFKNQSPDFHYEMIEACENNKNVAIAAPRGHAKSTIISLIFVLFRLCTAKEPYAILISDSYDQSAEQIGNIYAELLENEEIQAFYPHASLPKESQSQKKQKRQMKKRQTDFITIGGQRLRAFGIGMKLRGRRHREHRPTLCVCDDLENDEAVESASSRLKLLNWFRSALMPAVDIEGQIIVVGTVLSKNALLPLLISDEFSSFYSLMFAAHDEAKTPLWPDRFSYEKLMSIKSDIGSVMFAREFLNDPAQIDALFKMSWFEKNRVKSHPDLENVIVSVDPSVTGGAKSDECGIIILGKSATGEIFILEDLSIRATPAIWARKVLDAAVRARADAIVAEGNNGGDMIFEVFKAALHPGEIMPQLRIVKASRGKLSRAEPVAALYEKGIVKHVGIFEALESQLASWVPGRSSPDRMDALVWGISDLRFGRPTFMDLQPILNSEQLSDINY